MNTQALLAQAYAAFNRRDIDATLALMYEDVSWPKASEGGRVIGKQAIREYWGRQWAEFDPSVNVFEVFEQEDGKTRAKVHQLVKNLDGDVLSDTDVWHTYTIRNGLIERMDLEGAEGEMTGRSAAFAGH